MFRQADIEYCGCCRRVPAFRAMQTQNPVDRAAIAAAASRIQGLVRHTPMLSVPKSEFTTEHTVNMKLELLQHAGSFKPRGAFNRLLSTKIPSAGVIAASGGNHGAAVAYAARALGVPAEIFVPAATPGAKIDRIASYGAKVVAGGAAYADAYQACQERQRQTGALDVHAYDHADVLAGQGTLARELEHDAPDLTHILVATGGGGLIGGVAAWYAGSAQIISVEPESCPTLHDALQAGEPVDVAVSGLAADSLGARRCGSVMFSIAQRHVSAAVLVSDEAIRSSQVLLWDRFRLIAEPGGAAATAALLSGAWTPPTGARIGIVVCGANTDPVKITG
jgi:threonine dehydratase